MATLSIAVLGYAALPSQGLVPDPIAKIASDIKSGRSNLTYDERHGYLKGLLKLLEIEQTSQTLVWSKTSLQGPRISPRAPRAIYFNEHTYVGWVNGGELIEIATVHPEKGTRFYSIPNEKQDKLVFNEEFQRCIACHAGPGLGGVPRLLSRSVNADSQGYQILRGGGRIMTPRTPFKDRWGGWYVSGTHGKQRHRGNAPAVGDDEGFTFDPELGANKTDLTRYFNVGEYLNPHSDIVALMVLEHQMDVQNEIIRAGNLTRKIIEDPQVGTISEAAEPLVRALLSIGEVQLQEPIKGMGAFQRDYEKGGRRDRKGRSLRDLDLSRRLYKYRLSPMIESASFKALPKEVRFQVMTRLREIADERATPVYDEIDQADRTFLREFLDYQ